MSVSLLTSKPKLLHRRAIVPAETSKTSTELPDLDNVQGDVAFMFPKRWQRFLFFKIIDIFQFRKDLGEYAPQITSSAQTAKDLNEIHEKGGEGLDIVSSGIAFTRAGLNMLEISRLLRDPHFDQGSLFNERQRLGDASDYDEVFDGNGNNHGVIMLTAGYQETCRVRMEEIKERFNKSIDVVTTYEGRVREGEGEHFGWRDGISQPALEGVSTPRTGQRIVKPGVLILGYPGDPVYDDNTALARPDFTKDGSFMVFRKLEQNVLFLEDYINRNWESIPPNPENGIVLNETQRKQLFAARLIGRFKSGVPLALCPYVEDTQFLDPEKINNFDFAFLDSRCPFSSHIRKTSPRNLHPIVSKEHLDASVIVRAGIPYGEEVSTEEREKWARYTEREKERAKCDRGLLFVCYQSSIHNGFHRQTVEFAQNEFFPPTGPIPQKIGQDPILGAPKDAVEITDFERGADASMSVSEQKFFVTSRGGDYYFVPSIATVKEWASSGSK